MNFLKQPFIQPLCWVLVLGMLYFMNRNSTEYTLCIFKFAGFDQCAGCGIGHAISEALHFNFSQSIQTHIMGIPAAFFLMLYIIRTFISSFKQTAQWTRNC